MPCFSCHVQMELGGKMQCCSQGTYNSNLRGWLMDHGHSSLASKSICCNCAKKKYHWLEYARYACVACKERSGWTMEEKRRAIQREQEAADLKANLEQERKNLEQRCEEIRSWLQGMQLPQKAFEAAFEMFANEDLCKLYLIQELDLATFQTMKGFDRLTLGTRTTLLEAFQRLKASSKLPATAPLCIVMF
jgi:hypothetical protein